MRQQCRVRRLRILTQARREATPLVRQNASPAQAHTKAHQTAALPTVHTIPTARTITATATTAIVALTPTPTGAHQRAEEATAAEAAATEAVRAAV